MWKSLCILALVASPLRAQMVPMATTTDRSNQTLTYGWMSHVMGLTFCLHGHGYSFVAAGLSAIDEADTKAHELKHQEQMSRFPTCEAFDAATKGWKGQVVVEAEAYATGLCVSVAMGADQISLERNYAERISYWNTKGEVSPRNIIPMIQYFEPCRRREKP